MDCDLEYYNKWQKFDGGEEGHAAKMPVTSHGHGNEHDGHHQHGPDCRHDHAHNQYVHTNAPTKAPGFGAGPQAPPQFETLPDDPAHALSKDAISLMDDISSAKDGSLRKRILQEAPGTSFAGKPVDGMWVKCQYIGRLLNGALFDSSEGKKKPTCEPAAASGFFKFQVGKGVIAGWSEAIVTMEEGEHAKFYISAGLNAHVLARVHKQA